jgi:hypothetical protein
MDENKARELVGKPILISFSKQKNANVYGAKINQLSPSGAFIRIHVDGIDPYWTSLERVHLLEELFESPQPPPPPQPPQPREVRSRTNEGLRRFLRLSILKSHD